MDKNAIKKYATWARTELISRVTQRAEKFDISADADPNADTIRDVVLTDTEKKQRTALIKKVKEKGFDQVMEEVAYTWFNRFSALRFMEVNNYLPSRVRVFTNENNEFKPQILTEAIHMELDGLDMEKVYALKESNNDEELYKYLIITQCNALSAVLPGMFQKIADYTELLFPDNLLREGSVIQRMVDLIPEEDWRDQVQILGWLYQYYIAEPKDRLINARKQYSINDIAFVTQLFTSDWIVRFIVENSLGRLWLDGHPNDPIKNSWKYYVDEDVAVPIQMKQKAKSLHPEELKCIDPCAGSGHIIAYAFDVLMQIYLSYGYTNREAVESIVKNNIFGLDIDERAIQIANFAIMMKAREYDNRFLNRGIQPNIYVIAQGNDISLDTINYFNKEDPRLSSNTRSLIDETSNASIFGSLIKIEGIDFKVLYKRIEEIKSEHTLFSDTAINEMLPLIHSAELLSQSYAVVFTNPPYMTTKYMPNILKDFVNRKYKNYKSDLFASFIVRCNEMCEPYGHLGFLSPYVWMFIQSYEKLRQYVYQHMTFSSLVQLEYNAFEAACVPVAAFTFRNYPCSTSFGCIKLSDFKGIENQAPKTLEAIEDRNCGYRYLANQDKFKKIPGAPVAYWVNESVFNIFDNSIPLEKVAPTRKGMFTGNNDLWLKLWFEIDYSHFLKNQMPYNKGGEFRKWYGNNDYVVNWINNGKDVMNFKGSGNINPSLYFKECITWSLITSYKPSFRAILDENHVMGDAGPIAMASKDNLLYLLGLLNSKPIEMLSSIMAPTINFSNGVAGELPIIFDDHHRNEIENIVKDSLNLSKCDWDSFENSWDFKRHPFCPKTPVGSDKQNDTKGNISEHISTYYEKWKEKCNTRFNRLRENEEKLNSLFIDIYGLNNEISPLEDESDVTVRKADLKRDVKSFISYSVGCMFGRYSLDQEGLVYAGGKWDPSKYRKFHADKDGIIPICDDEYFDDDITGRFIDFVRIVYGEETLDDNLNFIANAIGGNGSSREIIRKYFINDFFIDHCNTYSVTGSGKRPIYWLFDSGKKNGFKCLIYMHRYQPDTIARIRTDYVHEQQARYRTAISGIERQLVDAPTSERVRLNNQLKKLKDQAEETRIYEEKIHHLADQMISIDLDDGVKHNYAIFQDVLAKIK